MERNWSFSKIERRFRAGLSDPIYSGMIITAYRVSRGPLRRWRQFAAWIVLFEGLAVRELACWRMLRS
jgi:hypothetical protein